MKVIAFLIPHECSNEPEWLTRITQEKAILDKIIALGIKAQQYELVDIAIEFEDEKYFIKGLKTKTLQAVCEEENLVLHDRKVHNYDSQVIGVLPELSRLQFLVDNQEGFAKAMLKKILVEYAIAYAFKLPISLLQGIDDSEHFYFTQGEAPLAGYFFWDVYADSYDFRNTFSPVLPTLTEFKAGPYPSFNYHENKNIVNLMNSLASELETIAKFKAYKEQIGDKLVEINKKMEEAENKQHEFDSKDQYDQFMRGLINEHFQIGRTKVAKIIDKDNLANSLLRAVDDVFLQAILNEAREVVYKYVEQLLIQGVVNEEAFMSLMKSVISLNNLNLVERLLDIFPNYSKLDNEKIDTVFKWCSHYSVSQGIREHLQNKLVKKACPIEYLCGALGATHFQPAKSVANSQHTSLSVTSSVEAPSAFHNG